RPATAKGRGQSTASNASASWPLNQFQAVAGRIDRDAYNDTFVSVKTRIAGHRAAGGLNGGGGRRHVLHVEDHVGDRVLYVVRIAVHDHDPLALVGLCALDRRTEIHEDLRSSGCSDPVDLLHAERRLVELR